MKIDLTGFVKKNETVAVALSGGSDSMALLHYMHNNAKLFGFKVIALNVEHGIRGEASKKDTEFVKTYCQARGIEIICYQIDTPAYAKQQKLSIEQAGRVLRYKCFNECIDSGRCDKVATAHHLSDNTESVLLNLFRGTGLKGLVGINANFSDKIIRPLLSVKKEDIEKYITDNGIPYVTDQTNLSDDYTRNSLRHNVIPQIKQLFPEAEKSIARLSEIARLEDDFLDQTAREALFFNGSEAKIRLPLHQAIFNRAVIIALKLFGVEKDWQKTHMDGVYSLINLNNGAKICLPQNLIATREYDGVVLSVESSANAEQAPFTVGETTFDVHLISVERCLQAPNLKDGFYADLDKIPKTAVIRFKKDGDRFTKFGGGTKKLSDYLTDKKIPLRLRSALPLLANGDDVLAIFGVAVSDKIKVDASTENIITLKSKKLTREKNYE